MLHFAKKTPDDHVDSALKKVVRLDLCVYIHISIIYIYIYIYIYICRYICRYGYTFPVTLHFGLRVRIKVKG